MKTMRRLLCALLCAAVSLPSCAAAEGSEGVCYRVTGGKNALFLLGTIHVGNEAMYPVGEHILSALREADALVLECDTQSAEVVRLMAQVMCYPIGDTLQNHIPAETFALVERVCEQSGYPVSAMNALRPWAVASTLAVDATAASMGVDDLSRAMDLGVEKQVGALAGDLPRVYLETAADQFALLDGFSAELQAYMLKTTALALLSPGEYAAAGDADVANWPEWWAAGDADSFAESYQNSLSNDPEQALMAEYHEGLVTKRNRVMAEGLRALLEDEEPRAYFAMVGLMHLVLPDDSVVALLRDMGYTVERVTGADEAGSR